MTITHITCQDMGRADPLAFARQRFSLPDGVIYLDGNSLGALPKVTAARLARAVEQEWGQGLIRSWNQANWVGLPRAIGDRIAALLGAAPGEVIAADSTSANIFKLLAAAVDLAMKTDATRNVVISERGNFPTDLYMVQGLQAMLGTIELRLVDDSYIADAFDDSVAVALVTQVDYRSGRMQDMGELNRRAKLAGSRIIWDLSHSAGAVPVNLNGSGAELAVGCGYKYLNGGPGAPAYVYVCSDLQPRLYSPLSGWFGHAAPFAFSTQFVPAPGIERFQCGTPSILAMQALECGLATFDGIPIAALREKSLALSDLFWQLVDDRCAGFGLQCVSPRDHAIRGSQLSFSHANAYEIMQALIERGVIGDFRQPDLLRFGFTPLYTRFEDIWLAVDVLSEIMRTDAWQDQKYRHRNAVT